MLSAMRSHVSRCHNAPVAFCHTVLASFSSHLLLFLLLLLALLGFAVSASAQTVTTVNDTDSGFTYTGTGWFYSANRGFLDYNDDEHGTNTVGDSVSYPFTGTGIAFLGESESGGGNVKVYLDGALQATVNTYNASRQPPQTQWSISGLSSGSHTLKLVMQDGSYMQIDAVQVTATSSLIGTGEVHFYPRPGYEWRMPGGKFQGSNDGSTYTDLYTITTTPAGQSYTIAPLSVDPVNYRYLRYLAPNGSDGNIAELAFYSGTGANAIKLTGAGFGTPVSYGNDGNDFTKALDGDTGTFFDAPAPGNGDYVGIDQQGAPLGTQALAINGAGGAASPYVADTDYSGGTSSSTTTAINTSGVTNPAPQAVYQSQRYGSFTYTLPGLTPGGSYLLRLHFAEIVYTASNMRRFNVSVNGTAVLSNFDIFASSGGANKAVVESFPATASSGGAITVQFSAGSVDSAAVNGLEVLKVPPAAAYQVRFVPRPAYESRMVGGKFQGSNDGSSYMDLVTVTQTPARGEFTTLTLPSPASYRYLRFLSPDGNYGNIAELEFDKGTGSSAMKLAGTGFGTPGSYASYGNDFTKVFDGDLSTFFDAPAPGNGDYVGIDQGGVPPVALTAKAGVASAVLSWNALSGVTGYNVYRSTASGGTPLMVNSSTVTTNTFTDTGLTNGTTYYYFVTSLSAAGESTPSNTVSATPFPPVIDFGVTASPNNFGVSLVSGNASTSLTLTPLSTFSGNVTLSVTGLPVNVTAAFSPASPVPVAVGTPKTDILTFTSSGGSAGKYPLTLTAISGSLTHTVPLTLTVVGQSTDTIVLTDMYLTGTSPTLQLLLPNNPSAPQQFAVTRNGVALPIGSSSTYVDNNNLQFNTSTQNPVSYTYASQQASTSYTDSSNHTYTIQGASGTCVVVPMEMLASDNQAVDSRLDPRYSTNTLINHNFGITSYRGGLFAGFVSDPAKIGRSLIKFALPALPSGKYAWRVGSVLAYATRGFPSGTATAPVASATTVFCQRVSDTWTGSTVTWSLAPALPPVPSGGGNGFSISYDGSTPIAAWERWPMSVDVYSALVSNGGLLSVELASTNENSSGWTYFAKKEYAPTLSPFLLYAYGATN